jgi:hypothetical protein
VRYFEDMFVEPDADGPLWYKPDISEEEEVYAAAEEDALRLQRGQPLREYEMADGRNVTGDLELVVDCLRQDYTYVSPAQAHAVRALVARRLAYEQQFSKDAERRMPPALRRDYQSKVRQAEAISYIYYIGACRRRLACTSSLNLCAAS